MQKDVWNSSSSDNEWAGGKSYQGYLPTVDKSNHKTTEEGSHVMNIISNLLFQWSISIQTKKCMQEYIKDNEDRRKTNQDQQINLSLLFH